MENLKITVVGDGEVGKTCLLNTYITGYFPQDEYRATVFDQYTENIKIDNVTYKVTLWDTAGQEDYERLRPLSYSRTDCFLVCFCVPKGKDSYENIALKWTPEIKQNLPNVPIVLVATKTDLRSDPSIQCYTTDDGKKLKQKVKARSYVECSALLNQGLKDVIEEAVRVAANPKKPTQKCQLI